MGLTEEKPVAKPVNNKKKIQADLVEAVKKGDFKKSARCRESLKNMK
jgi:hypothetical protein